MPYVTIASIMLYVAIFGVGLGINSMNFIQEFFKNSLIFKNFF